VKGALSTTATERPHGHAADAPPDELIAAACVHLRRIGLLADGERPAWRLLSGGVSNWVLRFECGPGVVVKAALARLRVAEEWLADPTRAVFEGRAMAALGERLPVGDVPEVLFVDERAHLLGMTSAPAGARPWKEALLRGEVDLTVAARVGALLGRMHRAAWDVPRLREEFGDLSLFRQLRLDPYHRRAAQVAESRDESAVAAALRAGAAEMEQQRATLVHGDFSPKNLLVHAGGVMAIDFEVVHWGNQAFDTAFLLNHLALKAVHRPSNAAAYHAAAEAFFDAYTRTLARQPRAAVVAAAIRQVGCLLRARADGKSRAEYLDERGLAVARRLGAAVLLGEIADLPTLFSEAGR
jgi:5-methylthioribose kinase